MNSETTSNWADFSIYKPLKELKLYKSFHEFIRIYVIHSVSVNENYLNCFSF